MVPHSLFGQSRIPPFDGVKDACMLAVIPSHGWNSVGNRRLGETHRREEYLRIDDDFHQALISRRFQQDFMKGDIGGPVFEPEFLIPFHPARRAESPGDLHDPLRETPKLGQIRGTNMHGSLGGGKRFQEQANLKNLVEFSTIQSANERPPFGSLLQEAFALQSPNRLADWRAADLQFLGEQQFGKPLDRVNPLPHQLGADVLISQLRTTHASPLFC